jgi:hypothetical protein
VRPREGLGLVAKIVILSCREKDPIRPNCSPIIVLNELLHPDFQRKLSFFLFFFCLL